VDSALRREILFDRPKVYWPLQGSGERTFQDASVNALDLTHPTAATAFEASFNSPQGDIDGIVLQATTISRTVVSTVVNDFTMELLFAPYTLTSNDAIVFYNGSSGANGWGLLIDLNKTLQYLAGGVALGGNSVGTIDLGRFHHLTMVRRATVWEFWQNGNLITANAGTTTPNTPTTSTVLGSNHASAYAHAAIYETPLLPGRIKAHADAAASWIGRPVIDLSRSVFPTDDAATVYLDIQPLEVETFDTVYLDLTPSGTEFKETTDAQEVYLTLQVQGGECYSTAQIIMDGIDSTQWLATDQMVQTRFGVEADARFLVTVNRSGVPC
jgi:Concanavalin A-like lectin/glucanases superfamily